LHESHRALKGLTPLDLRAIRAALGWKQPQAARNLGVTVRTYKYYEAGETSSGARLPHIPQAIAVAMLAHKFNHDLQALLSVEQEPEE
jgi:transcriptional regulator with XRE-family HTH domain